MYIYVDEYNVKEYRGEVLKRYVNKSLVKAISNPTDEELREFGYKPLIEGEVPEYDTWLQYILATYTEYPDRIEKAYVVRDMELTPTEVLDNE